MIVDYSAESMTETERDSVENSICTIVSTPYATAPYIRSMGIKNYPPKSDSELSRNHYATEAITQCRAWEDRAKISEVIFTEENEVRMVIENV